MILAILLGILAAVRPSLALAYTPESPEVKAMVERGMRYLETAPPPSGEGLDDAGAMWLVGITLLKNGKDAKHPVVAAGIKRAQDIARKNLPTGYGGMYWNGLVVIFLCEVDPVKYKAEIKYYLDLLLKSQYAGGAWGYASSTQGDTSQSQYGVLALWTADQAGFDVPTDRVERVCHWLLRTQDPSGGFAYQPTDSGGARVQQQNLTPSLSAAGSGSLYICGDLLGLHGAPREAVGENDGLPPALKLVQEEKQAKKRRASKFDAAFLRRGEADGNAWFAKNYTINPMAWPFYYMYALERYQSFREFAENRTEKEPKWYNDGVEHLRKMQQSGGNWTGDHSDPVSTSFAILFLIRSTKKAIGKVVNTEGALVGGRGLPTDVTNVKMRGNQVVGVSTTKSVDDLLNLLEDADEGALESAIADAKQLAFGSDEDSRAKQTDRLRKIVAEPNFQARILAVKTLSQSRDLENVPILIYALGDPDWRVAKEARDGLRLISRRFDGFDMPDRSTPEQRVAAQQSWKQWYLSIRPEAEFIE
jgi:hypothetical protein